MNTCARTPLLIPLCPQENGFTFDRVLGSGAAQVGVLRKGWEKSGSSQASASWDSEWSNLFAQGMLSPDSEGVCLCVPTGSRTGAIDTSPTHAGLCGTRVQCSPPAPGPGHRGTQVCASGKEQPAHRYPDVQVLFRKSLPAHPSQTRDSLDAMHVTLVLEGRFI